MARSGAASLDLTINDFAGFRDYIAAIPAHIVLAEHCEDAGVRQG
jgi:hypothetical protein